ncbi:MAG: 50S ribosomal protein L6 [Candidatus Gracilibacteria bacterium]|nr:50S ribosomal protein L6 [Candidatus Gracilibacteria bacterium]
MSRIGKLPVKILTGVTINVVGNIINVKGPKGELNFEKKDFVSLEQVENEMFVKVEEIDNPAQKAIWGLTRTLVNNMVIGVTNGYEKALEIIGVGYKFEVTSPEKLVLAVGFSHKVNMPCPKGITIASDEKNKNILYVRGIDKEAVGLFADKVRATKKPEPYKGKGIRYVGEFVRRKAGKTAGKK